MCPIPALSAWRMDRTLKKGREGNGGRGSNRGVPEAWKSMYFVPCGAYNSRNTKPFLLERGLSWRRDPRRAPRRGNSAGSRVQAPRPGSLGIRSGRVRPGAGVLCAHRRWPLQYPFFPKTEGLLNSRYFPEDRVVLPFKHGQAQQDLFQRVFSN